MQRARIQSAQQLYELVELAKHPMPCLEVWSLDNMPVLILTCLINGPLSTPSTQVVFPWCFVASVRTSDQQMDMVIEGCICLAPVIFKVGEKDIEFVSLASPRLTVDPY